MDTPIESPSQDSADCGPSFLPSAPQSESTAEPDSSRIPAFLSTPDLTLVKRLGQRFFFTSSQFDFNACWQSMMVTSMLPSYDYIASSFRNILKKKPENKARITLVLDLDETLVLSSWDASKAHDHEVELAGEGFRAKVCVNLRPWAHYFLQEAAKHFELVAFTASDVSVLP